MDSKGLLVCARYSSAPNYFGYCGPPKNSSLIDHLRDRIGDREIENILSQFETLFLNLNLIAKANRIKDPFDRRVVEAYWIGNNLLTKVNNSLYISLLGEKFRLEEKAGRSELARLKYKFLLNQTLPHHSFHVLNIFKRTGHLNSNQTLETMDSCRIGWGKITKFQVPNSKFKIKPQYPKIKIKTKLLTIKGKKLELKNDCDKELEIDFKGKIFIGDLKAGDWVSYHWGFVCDLLTARQVQNLAFYTDKAINFFNYGL